MEQGNSGGAAQFGFNKPNAPQGEQNNINTNSPVENKATQTNNTFVANRDNDESIDILNSSYTDDRSVTISLVRNFSLYRKSNDKVLPKKKEHIGGSVSASRILSANKEEVEAYFPNIIGLSPNNDEFISRVKGYLNNIKVIVEELGLQLNTTFVYKKKSYYYDIKAQEEAIDNDLNKVDKQNLSKFKEAIKQKVIKLNILEGTKHKLGYPINVEEYLLYRHCLLYGDIAKDISLINSDPNYRFYFKDDQKEADKARKFRNEIVKAKTNYVSALSDNTLFDSIYAQYLVLSNQPVVSGLAEDKMEREIKLDRFSTEEPIKFNKIFTNKDVELIGSIELLIAHGELSRSQYNQNISTTDGQFIGSNMGEAVTWFKHPDNISTVNAYYNKLKNI